MDLGMGKDVDLGMGKEKSFYQPNDPLLEVPVFSGKGIVPSLKTVGSKVKCKR